jgi:hypothetical protein
MFTSKPIRQMSTRSTCNNFWTTHKTSAWLMKTGRTRQPPSTWLSIRFGTVINS